MVEHTPGPWTYEHDTCAQCRKEGVAEYIIHGPPGAYHGQFSRESDARLIASAPELLGLVEATATHFAGTDAPLGNQAREIIAKAKGAAA
ncbi:MAG: hypothetical protein V3S55_06235 [Nitrospiraceae bacterium]